MVFGVFLGGAGESFALPKCPGLNPDLTWTNCVGTHENVDGDKYVGEFKDGEKNGQGTYNWTDGDKYVGEFKDGASNGQGTYTYADGTVKEGIWKDWEFQYAKKLSPSVPEVEIPTQDDEIISASDLPDCPSDLSVRWHNCFGTYTNSKGDKYVGEWLVSWIVTARRIVIEFLP